MRQEIQLFLNGKEVFFSEPPQINFVYQRTDYTNPTVIKNSYTKTVTIEGTPENNKVFNSIYNLERTQGVNDEFYFNPSKRVPFELFENGDILEQGYAKLDKVNRQGYKIEYEITLYGGLGDFFYGLSYYEQEGTENGKKLTLGDLRFTDDTGKEIDLDFTINRDTVNDAWDKVGSHNWIDNKWDIINFVPAYNGLPKNFDCDKVLIEPAGTENTDMRKIDGSTVSDVKGFPVSDGDYGLYRGYALGQLNRELTEWEMRDLRSYLQRPVMSVKGLFNGIENATKYKLDLDKDFFRYDNPYWSDAYFTLPMLTNLENKSEFKGSYVIMDDKPEIRNGYDYRYRLRASFGDDVYKGVNSVKVRFRPTIWVRNAFAERLYPSFYPSGNLLSRVYGGCTAQLIGYDGTNNPVASSDIIFMTSTAKHGKYVNSRSLNEMPFDSIVSGGLPIQDEGYFVKVDDGQTSDDVVITKSGLYPTEPAPVIPDVPLIDGWDETLFTYQGETQYKWYRDLNLSLDAGQQEIAYVVLRFTFVNDDKKFVGVLATSNTEKVSRDERFDIMDNKGVVGRYIGGDMEIITPDEICSNAYISKKKLLSSIDGTPCDFLLSYCKLFNLYFEKDIYSDTIRIRHRSNWYDGEVIDIDKDIDRTKDIEIKPISFDNKFYDFKYNDKNRCEADEDYFLEKGVVFGTQKVDTGYNFDSSSNDLLKGTVFNNSVQIRETSKYFKFLLTNIDDEIGLPSFMNRDTVTYSLFNSVLENKELTMAYPTAFIDVNYSTVGDYFDSLDRLQLHKKNNEPMDGSGVLCFFCGFKPTERLRGWDSQGKEMYYKIDYRLTDDIQPMIDLNGKPCWIYTNNASHGVLINYMPHFSRYTNIQYVNNTVSTFALSDKVLEYGRPVRIPIKQDNAKDKYYEWDDVSKEFFEVLPDDPILPIDPVLPIDPILPDKSFINLDNMVIVEGDEVSEEGKIGDAIKIDDTIYIWDDVNKDWAVVDIEDTVSDGYVNGGENENRLLISSNQIGISWDFGAAASYLTDYRYSALSTIYARFWKNYIGDLYNVDTRIVTAYVRLKGKVLGDMLKHFYYFSNSIWALTKIIDYNITSFDTVKCEFAKVVDVKDYTDDISFVPKVILTPRSTDVIPATGGAVYVDVYVSDAGSWYSEYDIDAMEVSPDRFGGGKETTTVRIDVKPNTDGDERTLSFSVFADPSSASIELRQAGADTFTIALSTNNRPIPNDGGTKAIEVVCGGDWSISSDSPFAKFGMSEDMTVLEVITGHGDATVYCSIEPNVTFSSRTVNVTGVCGDESDALTIVQDANEYAFLNYNQNDCIGCDACEGILDVCPVGLSFIINDDGIRTIDDLGTCIGCGGCGFGSVCPTQALYAGRTAKDMIPKK